MSRAARVILELLIVATLGFAALAAPVFLDPGHRDYGDLIRTVVEGFRSYSLALLAGVGFLAGRFGSTPWFISGLATVAAFPAWSVFDALTRGGHSLFPIEMAFYAFYALFGIVGAKFGSKERTPRS